MKTNGNKSKIRLEKINMDFTSKKGTVHVLDNIDLCIGESEFVCFVGPSGCGKSTLLRIIAGLQQATSGSIYMNDKPLLGSGADRAMVFQDDSVFPWLTVEKNIEYGLKLKNMPAAERKKSVDHYLNLVGLTTRNLRKYYPKELSGGMRKRVDMARAFANDPEVLLMDEPFGMLDSMTKEILQVETMRIWADTKKTICFVTHDLEEAIFLSDRIVFMDAEPGRIYNIYYPSFSRPRDPGLKMEREFQQMRRELIDVMNTLMTKGERRNEEDQPEYR